jgi:hypothetical protein
MEVRRTVGHCCTPPRWLRASSQLWQSDRNALVVAAGSNRSGRNSSRQSSVGVAAPERAPPSHSCRGSPQITQPREVGAVRCVARAHRGPVATAATQRRAPRCHRRQRPQRCHPASASLCCQGSRLSAGTGAAPAPPHQRPGSRELAASVTSVRITQHATTTRRLTKEPGVRHCATRCAAGSPERRCAPGNSAAPVAQAAIELEAYPARLCAEEGWAQRLLGDRRWGPRRTPCAVDRSRRWPQCGPNTCCDAVPRTTSTPHKGGRVAAALKPRKVGDPPRIGMGA